MDDRPFENVRGQIGFCGVWCGSCVVGNGALRELTRRYKEVIKGYGLEGWAPSGFDFGEFMRGLEFIQAMPLCEGCRKGGGRDGCEIRACASSRGLEGCGGCGQPEECESAELLRVMRQGALDAGLMVDIENVKRGELIERWSAEIRSRWPSRVIFIPDR
jgi:hypothetical protein